MNSDDLKKIREGLSNSRNDVRKKALTELKKLPPSEALKLLVTTLGEKNDDVQADLMRAFLSYRDAALPHLVKAFSDPEWGVRKAASRIIGALGDSALAKFLELIPRNEDDIDYWMVQTLSIMGGEATRYLIKAFEHPNRKVRIAAVRAAGDVKEPQIVEALLKLLEEKIWPLREAAFASLEKVHHLNGKAIVDALKSASCEAKFWVIRLAAQRRDPNLIPVFLRIIEVDPQELKLEAIQALSAIETPEVQKILIGFLAHRSWIIRKTTADAIWKQGLGVSEELLTAATDPNVDARYWSVKLLGRTNEPKVFPQLIERLRDAHASVRAAACQALGSLAVKQALTPLMTLLSDPAEEVRTSAILAISQIGEKEDRTPEKAVIPRHLQPENQISCRHCGKRVGRDFAFCPFCLGHIKITCKKCGRAVESEWKGCPDCGEPF